MSELTAPQELAVQKIVWRALVWSWGALVVLAGVAVPFLAQYAESLSETAVRRVVETRLNQSEPEGRKLAELPVGSIVLYAGPLDQLPSGWVACDGRSLSREQYSSLFDAIGTAHGDGGLQHDFNLPDPRGRFFRGVDHRARRDPDSSFRQPAQAGGNDGDAVGSIQLSASRRHGHDAV